MPHRAQQALVAAFIATSVGAQQRPPQPDVRHLARPTFSITQDFSGIEGVRELRDGRVILLDARDRAIHVIDLPRDMATVIGGVGDGPGEYRLLQQLFRGPADTIAVSDMARAGRLLVITQDGATGGLMTMTDSAAGPRSFYPRASDASGRFYTTYAANSFTDSTAIIRWDRKLKRLDTVAKFMATPVSPLYKGPPVVQQMPGGRGSFYRPGPILPFATSNQFAVADDGRIAIVEAEPYRVTYVHTDGKRVEGPIVIYPATLVSSKEKEDFIREIDKPSPGVFYNGSGQLPTYEYRRMPTPSELMPQEWPPTLPAFLREAVTFASDGSLWVKRARQSGAPVLYDVFDQSGRLSFQLELPAGRKAVGFGVGALYLARVDENDVHFLERYPLPTPTPARR